MGFEKPLWEEFLASGEELRTHYDDNAPFPKDKRIKRI